MIASTEPHAVSAIAESIHPCIVHSPPAWQPLSRAQILMMAIQLRRMQGDARPHWSVQARES